ncbi:uncharacterized protein Z518_08425 [Rhinocladiella mackenziei CBS 650.93]|uniref:TauD/TfdA-like domain-containing protein n=1 Tax=Rhinocladiella mackenziei CBS 650.93 TaxID=1442369 RepID=A0A0D2I9I5_9EURO|nr:uncharacterized protein Z518_08425 [Rhinocladiella mackenziei CBS 650.93]KIX02484.1 hypothetical protein Z518_08425 [Rhinocladiella mackenziei CBS 650.93]
MAVAATIADHKYVSQPTIYSTAPETKPKTWSCTEPNPDFVPPKDFELPSTLAEVPLNPKGPTEIPQKTARDYNTEDYKWKQYLPYNTLTAEPPLSTFDHVDPAFRADPEKKSLFEAINRKKDITPVLGTEVWDTQLSSLTDKQKDELALYVAERGLVVFRDQDFVYKGPDFLKEYGTHFGRLHVHCFGVHVKNHPELVIVFRDSDDTMYDNMAEGSLNSTKWHSDMSYELNPPGTTFLCQLTTPEAGGDTLYLSAMEAYNRLSPPMQKFLESLSAVHDGKSQSQFFKKSNLHRREPIDGVHPLVRTHPVTGRKALYCSPGYTKKIVGLKKEESDNILQFLYDHLQKGQDFHARVRWEQDTVVVYDNRMVLHSVVLDYPLGHGSRRHLLRLTPQAERPVCK